ncbi:ACP S-malonyltransferase [Nocardia jinanensis]|uniref:Malonyl CoA-acyl carrier protein transacylase n=1 Tax=Nocardia jinanensis TaxID=382504 RepID=A0A917W097_9NOCA|nr:ACP S-malonyltransferase [Nocardia jinanensis]GGL46416.1 malonyl CoA-acyl carrier protein transacylase [Nocardia jinanensis]
MSPRVAFVFPGQGSQRPGMGGSILDHRPDLLGTYYRRADSELGFGLTELCLSGPVEALREMATTQPAVLLTSVAALAVLQEQGVVPDVVAGHSLGEYMALVCAGSLNWVDALRLVRLRGRLMAEANAMVPGRMAAVIGLPVVEVESLCGMVARETGRVIEVANHNDPRQVVVSGEVAAVARFMELIEGAGAERAVVLRVGGSAHCSLLGNIEPEFTAALRQIEVRAPALPFVSSVSASVLTTATEVVDCLRAQLVQRVRWVEAVEVLSGLGVGSYIEVGPGKALAGMCGRIHPGAAVYRTDDWTQLGHAVEACARVRPAEEEAAI